MGRCFLEVADTTHSYLVSLNHPEPPEGHSVHLWLKPSSEDAWRRSGHAEGDTDWPSPHPILTKRTPESGSLMKGVGTPSRRVQVWGRGEDPPSTVQLTPFTPYEMPVHPPVRSTTALAGPPSPPLAWITSVPQNRRCLLLSSEELRCHGWLLLQSRGRPVLVMGRLSPGGGVKGRLSPSPPPQPLL